MSSGEVEVEAVVSGMWRVDALMSSLARGVDLYMFLGTRRLVLARVL